MVIKINKRGVWRVIEAVIAVLILAGALLLILSKQPPIEEKGQYQNLIPILEEIAKNKNMRDKIVNGDLTIKEEIINILKKEIPNADLDYGVNICGISDNAIDKACRGTRVAPLEIKGNVYSVERVISSSLTQSSFMPRVVKIYVWER